VHLKHSKAASFIKSDQASTAAASTIKNYKNLPVEESWKEKESLKLAIASAQANRRKFVAVLKALDKDHSNHCSLTLFLQSSVDQSINFDERTI